MSDIENNSKRIESAESKGERGNSNIDTLQLYKEMQHTGTASGGKDSNSDFLVMTDPYGKCGSDAQTPGGGGGRAGSNVDDVRPESGNGNADQPGGGGGGRLLDRLGEALGKGTAASAESANSNGSAGGFGKTFESNSKTGAANGESHQMTNDKALLTHR